MPVSPQVAAFEQAIYTHLSAVENSIQGIEADAKFLNDEIARLNTTKGVFTPEDEQIFAGIEARAKAMATRVQALDDLTPPSPIVIPPTPPAPTP